VKRTKHKRSGLGLAGVSHAIRRPKKRPAVKISQIPAVSIELPSRSASVPSTPHGGPLVSSPGVRRSPGGKTPSSSYRKMSKISTTPLRRSGARKNLSPLKESYLAESGSRNGRRSGGGARKLFSPQGPADFLLEQPASGNKSPRKLIFPSPVKKRL